MSYAALTLSQQPRWLLLSLFLVLWSWSTGFRRDGHPTRGKALGLGVDARAAPVWEAKRQVGLPICAQQCALQAQETIGCGDSLNLQCACHSAQFFPGAVDCMTANCTSTDKQNGQDTLMTACKAVGTSVSLPTSFPTGTGSITSGVPSISGSASATTTLPSPSPSSSPSSASASSSQSSVSATATVPPSSSTTSAGPSTDSSSGSGTTAAGTSTQGSGSTPSSTGTSGSGNGAGARGVSWPAVALGVALAVAGAAASL